MTLPNMVVDTNAPPDTIYFLSPRKVIAPRRVLPNGKEIPAILEKESEWIKRCGLITGLKV